MTIALNDLLKDSAYKLTQFKNEQIEKLEKSIFVEVTREKPTAYINCLVRDKKIKLTPEEVVRQLYLMVLIDDLGYSASRIAIEHGINFGREVKRADICIFDKDRPTVPYILVELKKPKLKDGKEQLKSYCNASGAPMGVWSNGESISFYHRKDPLTTLKTFRLYQRQIKSYQIFCLSVGRLMIWSKKISWSMRKNLLKV